MSDADPADRFEQEPPVEAEDADLPARIVDVDIDAPEADALEQALPATAESDDDRR